MKVIETAVAQWIDTDNPALVVGTYADGDTASKDLGAL